MLYKYLFVFLGAAVPWLEVAVVVPLGIVWGLSPFWVMIIAILGNMMTVLALIFGFDRIKVWYIRRREKKGNKASKQSRRAVALWNKYGLPGLAFLGPILIGTHIAAFIGMVLGAERRSMSLWIGVSIVWVLIFGMATVLGFDFFLKNI
ncbi:MAG TPA: small multi-drug export protein [Bacillota bacterium]|nr:small multi-drug export protein [Bacillota bacterium]